MNVEKYKVVLTTIKKDMETMIDEIKTQVDRTVGLTVEEAYEAVCNELKSIYKIKDAI